MIMAERQEGMAEQIPKRHVHAGRSRELAMIMGLVPVGGPESHDHEGTSGLDGTYWPRRHRR